MTQAMTFQHAEKINRVLQNPAIVTTFFSMLLNSK